MSGPWLHVIGIGAEGISSLMPAARALLDTAEVIIGGERHLGFAEQNLTAERIEWPSPFSALIETIASLKGRRVVVLATGDPLWYSVGARLGRAFPADEITFTPQLSAFQLAACRMGWSLADAETLTVHGRPAEQIIPYLAPDARLIILGEDGETPAKIGRILAENGYGESTITVLAAMGRGDEARFTGTAKAPPEGVPDFHTLAVACKAVPGTRLLGRGPGLPDDAFRHDGNMTKHEVRAATLARLQPSRGGVLWDIGAGCGSVAIEWMRAARDAEAIAIEPRADRRALAAENALALGAPRLEIIDGTAPAALAGLKAPDAIFIGGGLSRETFAACRAALKPHGRLVANAVTLETEAVLVDLWREHGGELVRIAIARAEAIGGRHGWRPLMPVTQWALQI